MADTFCILPWIHTQTKPNGQIKPCCRFDHKHKDYRLSDNTYKFDKFNINSVNFTDALNSPEWQELRTAMIAGDTIAGCRKCYKEEDVGVEFQAQKPNKKNKSMRVKENSKWNNDIQNAPLDTSIKLKYLELTMGNYCNLKCRTCSSDLSTTWVDEQNILSKYYLDKHVSKSIINIEKDWDIEDFDYVEEIKFTGGEPMLHPNFIKTIDTILATGKEKSITLDIFTNASWIPKDKVISRLKRFKEVTINLSIDGIGVVNDYIRSPSEWSTVNAAAREWLTLEKNNQDTFLIKWAPVISIMNADNFTAMVDWWFNLQKEVKNKNWWDIIVTANTKIKDEYITLIIVNTVYDPIYLNPSLLPEKNKTLAFLLETRNNYLIQLKNSKTKNQELVEMHLRKIFNKVISSINVTSDSSLLQSFIEYTADLDKIRGQDMRISLPELWKRIEGLAEYKGRIDE